MQLKNPKKIGGALRAATSTLLALNSSVTIADEGDWEIDSAILYYSETDRVTAIEPVIAAKRDFGEEKALNFKLVFDSLTGASANGATPSDQVQTFTRPSGEGSYTTSAGETPLDDTFQDRRVALSTQWDQPLGRDYKTNVGANVSTEYDYFSLGINGSLSRYFNNRNTTLTAGLSFANDTIEPEGGVPREFSSMVINTEHESDDESDDEYESDDEHESDDEQESDESKTTTDFLLGVTQVINRRTITQFNYSFSNSSGYLTDPFKILSVVGSDGRPQDYVYESRPDSRTKHALYSQMKYHFNKDIVDLSYRYMWDDWGISSHTFDMRYRWMLGNKHYLEPHFRYYMQSEADFYHRFLRYGEALPEHASADYRLGELNGITLGLKYGMTLANGQKMSIRFEYYLQSGDANASNVPGILSNQDLFPDLDAMIFQFSYSF
jgi:hypothetical protein